MQIAIVAAAIFAGYLFVRFETSHGRSFSGGMAINLVIIGVFVVMILWGWKALVHLIARVISGTTASAVLLGVSVIAILLTIAVFAPWLLLLFVLTALSFIVFLPVRSIYGLWLFKRKITYRCPYDDDDYSGPPIHICSVASAMRTSTPASTAFSIIPAEPMATKNGFPRWMSWVATSWIVCAGACGRPLMFSALGELAVQADWYRRGHKRRQDHFPAAGDTGVASTLGGKIWQQGTNRVGGARERSSGPTGTGWIEAQVLAKTSGDVIKAFGVAARLSKKQRYLLYLFDAPGEVFGKTESIGRKLWFQSPAGIILFVDPFSLPELTDHAMRKEAELKASEISFRQINSTLITGIKMMLAKQSTDRCQVPLAVVIGKADSCQSATSPFFPT